MDSWLNWLAGLFGPQPPSGSGRTVSTRLTDDLYRKLLLRSTEDRLSVSAEIARLVEAGLKPSPQPAARLVGVNVDQFGVAARNVVLPTGSWVRLVLPTGERQAEQIDYLRTVRRAGLHVLVVVASESFPSGVVDQPPPALIDWASVDATLRSVAPEYVDLVDAWQIGNEPDNVSPASWTLRATDWNQLARIFRQIHPAARMIGPGLVSGRLDYLDQMDLSLVEAIAVHPYGLAPGTVEGTESWCFNSVANTLGDYVARARGLPIWVTEFGINGIEHPDESYQADYLRRMFAAMATLPFVRRVIHFCLSDAMVDGFGLLRVDGTPKPAWQVFLSAVGE
jgi:hypothetical protein